MTLDFNSTDEAPENMIITENDCKIFRVDDSSYLIPLENPYSEWAIQMRDWNILVQCENDE